MFCNRLPFSDLGFMATDENMWIKYTNDQIPKPHFALTTTINALSHTFVVKDLIKNEMFSTKSYDKVKEYIISTEREIKLKKLLD
jgi:succinate dehydrogenase/fumarate reductase-like Fe-S protein